MLQVESVFCGFWQCQTTFGSYAFRQKDSISQIRIFLADIHFILNHEQETRERCKVRLKSDVNGRENLLLKFIDFLLLLSRLANECVFDFTCLQISILHGIWLRVIVIPRIYYVHMLCLCRILPSYKAASYTDYTRTA